MPELTCRWKARVSASCMRAAGLLVELLETRHLRNAFKAMSVKTDRKGARGIAQLMRLGWFWPVHCKLLPPQELRTVLTARKLVRSERHDVEMSLRGFGLKVGPRDHQGALAAKTRIFDVQPNHHTETKHLSRSQNDIVAMAVRGRAVRARPAANREIAADPGYATSRAERPSGGRYR
jgi:hypothetical protein